MTHSRINSFAKALARFEAALAEPETEMNRDATIQRFEFTFELAWKAIQVALREEGQDCMSPKSCLRAAFKQGWLENEEQWVAMQEDRNRTSHTYDEAFSRQLYARLPQYPELLNTLLSRLVELN